MRSLTKTCQAIVLTASIQGIGLDGAEAVRVNPAGLGQVLLFPYYSARSSGSASNNTVITLTNTGNSTAKAMRVRFREGKAGAEVLDFNVFLAPGQTWSVAVLPKGGGGAIISASTACSVPAVPTNAANAVAFVNFAYAGDGMGDGLDRTLEGHAEVIEMATYAPGSQTFAAVTPVNGVATCAVNQTVAATEAQPPSGNLMGYAEIVNVLGATSFAAGPTALDAFTTTGQYFTPGDSHPDLSDVNPPTATVVVPGTPGSSVGAGTLMSASGFARSVDAVSFVLMHNQVVNNFEEVLGYGGATDWVVTYPTKSLYYSEGTPVALFQRPITPSGACDDVNVGVNGALAGIAGGALCFATNVITFNGGVVLGSANAFDVATSAQSGWASVQPSFVSSSSDHRLIGQNAVAYVFGGASTSGSVTVFGLPTIGFAARRLLRGLIETPDASISATNADTELHKYRDSFIGP